MPSKLKPVLFLGIAGGVVAALRKRSAQAGELASNLADRAKEAAPESVKQVVDKATGGPENGGGSRDETRRYAAPAEAGSQPPAEAGGSPSDDPQATAVRSVPSDPSDLATPPKNLPDDVVVPDTSTDDPAVQDAEAAAAADAAAIGRSDDDEPKP
jgi:hypothetical protein